MTEKRGRKSKNERYFGPEEEEAVIKFLNLIQIETVNFVKNQPISIKHELGQDITVGAYFVEINELAYGKDDKFINIDFDVNINNKTDTGFDISCEFNIENAFVVITNENERNLVFNKWLKAPLDKMIESIIRRYKLYRKGFTFEELHSDTVSFLMTKAHKFEAGRGKKAYSYFGTIVKNFILGLLIKDNKHSKQSTPFDDVTKDLEERDDLKYTIDEDTFDLDNFLVKLVQGVKDEINAEPKGKKKMSENEKKVGIALVELLENWETAFDSMRGGAKYNKNSVLETMRNYTNLSTKDIRLAMKRYKGMYDFIRKRSY